MANTSVVQKPGKGHRSGSSIIIGMRLTLALAFLAIVIVMFRQGANQSNWLTLMLYFIAFVITDRVAFAIRLRILHRQSDFKTPKNPID